MYRIHQIKLKLGEKTDKLPEKILKKLGRSDILIKNWKIARESIDARDKNNIFLVYSVDFEPVYKKNAKKQVRLASNNKVKLEIAKDEPYRLPEPGEAYRLGLEKSEGGAIDEKGRFDESIGGAAPRLTNRPVVVGFGPAGMFAALILAEAGYKPIVLERGASMARRVSDIQSFWNDGKLDEDSNVLFGEGGAGTFSDGKLTTGIKDKRIGKVLQELADSGAPSDILYKQKPHVGTDVLRQVVVSIRKKIESLGGQVRFGCKVSDILVEDGCVSGLVIEETLASGNQGDKDKESKKIDCEAVIFAIGHSARDTFEMLLGKGLVLTQKPFSIGFRIEHPQELIDKAQYGRPAGELGLAPAEYKLSYRTAEGRGVYTFCMCPGGQVIACASEKGGVLTNGMSYRNRDSGTANSALLCDVRTSDFGADDPLAGVRFQRKYEQVAFVAGGGNYRPPKSTWGEFAEGRAENIKECLPAFATEAFLEAMPELGKKLKGFDSVDAVITAVETRSSSPVRINRDENMQGLLAGQKLGADDKTYKSSAPENELDEKKAILTGFYPCGEGAGYAGGITSAAVDGIKVAESIIKHYLPLN